MPNPRRSIRIVLQLLALGAVAVGLLWSLQKARDQLRAQRLELLGKAVDLRKQAAQSASVATGDRLRTEAEVLERKVSTFWQANPMWIFVAGVAYATGMIPAACFWRSCLRAFGQPSPALPTFWAYFLGHLGKYFPGKAMVLVLRVGALEHLGVRKVATVLTILMETLTMMAVGGAVAAICLLLLQLEAKWTLLAIALLAVTVLPTLPPVLKQLLRRLQRGVDPATMQQWLDRITWSLLARGWVLLFLSWIAFGASLFCVLRGLPSAEFGGASMSTIALSATSACALAMVLGFVSFLPAGAGVREIVVSTVLTPVVGPVAALASAIWLRFTWIAAELIVVGILWCVSALVKSSKGNNQASANA